MVCWIVTFLLIGSNPMLSVSTASGVGGELNMVFVPEMVCNVMVSVQTYTGGMYIKLWLVASAGVFAMSWCMT
jgi:hypothetical protein